MVYRFSWIAGIAAIGLAFWELTSVMRPSTAGTAWQVVVILATLLGAGITWTAIAYRARASIVVGANVGAIALLSGLIVAPDTLFFIFPTGATWTVLVSEFGRAFEAIQRSVEPVRPLPGLVLLLALLFWALGFLLTAGLLNNRPFVAVLTPIVVAVQISIIDRAPKSFAHLSIFILIVVLGLLAVRADEQDQGTGKLQRVNSTVRPNRRPTASIGLLIGATAAAGLFAVSFFGDSVPNDGFASWRAPSGFSDDYSGSSSYNPFIDIKAGLISLTDNPLFQAEITGADPESVRFRTVTLDVYRNGRWATDRIFSYPLDDGVWIEPDQEYKGETDTVTVRIKIENLAQTWMPAPTTPTLAFAGLETDTKNMEVRRLDGSLTLRGDVTYPGMEYTVEAEIPRYTSALLASVARTESGDLSPLFKAAADAGNTLPSVATVQERRELDRFDFWTDIPDDLGPGVNVQARRQTKGLTSNFEIALALEYYFRSSGLFVYNTDIPGEFTTSDVSDWLTDETNPYVRNGYCEQFATAMALMARSLGVPARVVLGFTAGEALNDTVVQVRDKNAHAWVEIWVPTYGWMSFDPTPRGGYAAVTANDTLTELLDFSPYEYLAVIPVADIVDQSGGGIGPESEPLTPREERDVRAPASGDDGAVLSSVTLPDWASWVLPLAAIVILVAAASPALKWLRRRRRMKRLKNGDISAAWEDITERLFDLGDPFTSGATPLEAATSVDEALVPLAHTFGRSLYGDVESSVSVIDRALAEHAQAVNHLSTRYSSGERLRAAVRPTRGTRRLSLVFNQKKRQSKPES